MRLVNYIVDICVGSWRVAAEMAPYLLFGFLVAGVLSVLVSPAWVERHLGGRGLLPVVKSVLLGVPLPLCSCGVIAVSASIRKHGASRGATAGFLLATPQTGVDSILATWGMLGPVFGVFRPLVAMITGVIGGVLVDVLDRDAAPKRHDKELAGAGAACPAEPKQGALRRILAYGLVTLPRDIARPLLIGILIAALIGVLLPPGFLNRYVGGGILAMLVMVAVGIPLYVCSTASIPLALGFMHLGASPGAALAFLIAGPATNAATIAIVWKVLGRRTGLIYLGTVAFGALFAGLALDFLYQHFEMPVRHMGLHEHEMTLGWVSHGSAVFLMLVLVWSLAPWRRWVHGAAPVPTSGEGAAMDTVTLIISGMTCSHCTSAVLRGLSAAAGVSGVQVDLGRGRAVVTGDQVDGEALCRIVRDLGYHAELAG